MTTFKKIYYEQCPRAQSVGGGDKSQGRYSCRQIKHHLPNPNLGQL